MAKKKKSRARSYTRRAKKTYKRSHSKQMKIMGVDLVEDLALPGAYGAVRADIANFVMPYARQLPVVSSLGENADEVGMIAALTLASKFVGNKVPVLRKLARNGIRIEAAQIGQNVRLRGFGVSSTPAATQSFR